MKVVDKYILVSFIRPFLVSLILVTFILVMQFLWLYMDDILGKGIESPIIIKLFGLNVAFLLMQSIPIATLLGSIMTFGSLGENYELVALKSVGNSLPRIMLPIALFVGLLSVGMYFYGNYVVTHVYLEFRTTLSGVQEAKPELVVKEGLFSNDIDGLSMRVDKKNNETGMLYDILIYDHLNNKGNTNVTAADSGKLSLTKDKKSILLTLHSGRSYQESQPLSKKEEFPYEIEYFEKRSLLVSIEDMGMQEVPSDRYRNNVLIFTTSNLYQVIDSFEKGRALNVLKGLYSTRGELTEISKRRSLFLKKDTLLPVGSSTRSYNSFWQGLSNEQRQQNLQALIENIRNTLTIYKQQVPKQEYLNRITNYYRVGYYSRFTLALACFLFFLLGSSFGAIIRKGGLGMPVLSCILFYMLYYSVSVAFEKLVKDGSLPGYIGSWVSTVVFTFLGVSFTYLSTIESPILRARKISIKSLAINPFYKKIK